MLADTVRVRLTDGVHQTVSEGRDVHDRRGRLETDARLPRDTRVRQRAAVARQTVCSERARPVVGARGGTVRSGVGRPRGEQRTAAIDARLAVVLYAVVVCRRLARARRPGRAVDGDRRSKGPLAGVRVADARHAVGPEEAALPCRAGCGAVGGWIGGSAGEEAAAAVDVRLAVVLNLVLRGSRLAQARFTRRAVGRAGTGAGRRVADPLRAVGPELALLSNGAHGCRVRLRVRDTARQEATATVDVRLAVVVDAVFRGRCLAGASLTGAAVDGGTVRARRGHGARGADEVEAVGPEEAALPVDTCGSAIGRRVRRATGEEHPAAIDVRLAVVLHSVRGARRLAKVVRADEAAAVGRERAALARSARGGAVRRRVRLTAREQRATAVDVRFAVVLHPVRRPCRLARERRCAAVRKRRIRVGRVGRAAVGRRSRAQRAHPLSTITADRAQLANGAHWSSVRRRVRLPAGQ